MILSGDKDFYPKGIQLFTKKITRSNLYGSKKEFFRFSHEEKVSFSRFGKLEYFGLVNNHDHVLGENMCITFMTFDKKV